MTKKAIQRFSHLVALGQEVRARAESAGESAPQATAAEITEAARKARMPTSAAAPTGLASAIIAAGKKRRGEV
jgi:hypothetical protein